MNPAYEDSVQLVLRLLREQMGDTFTYFDGDPDLLATHDLPAIIVEQLSDTTTAGTFGEDDITDSVLVKVVYNKSDDWTGKRENLNLTHRKVREAIGGRDEAGNYRPGTVKAALRPEVYGERRIGGDVTVDYGFLRRPEDIYTSEGHLTINVEYSVTV